jgi:Fic/DOC family
VNPLSQIHHCTQFMLDFVACEAKKETNSFQDYMKREDNYDLSFCEAWINHVNTKVIDDAEKLFEFFMKIQKTAMNHIELIGKTSQGKRYQSGIYIGNTYCVSNSLVSDLEGIKELVSQVWFDKKNTLVTVYSEKKLDGFHDIYFLNKDGFYNRNTKLKINTQIFSNDSSKESFEIILNTIQKYYDVGLLEGGFSPLRIQPLYDSKESKKAKAVELFNNYLISIKNLELNEEKILKICDLCRELEQLHLFYDGNGRSVFILANLLACWNNLNPFYPKNMCIFDANSLRTMVQEVTEGQERFTSLFGSKEQFTRDLNEYKIKVEILTGFAKEKFSKFDVIMKSVKERNFNLLLRQAVSSKNTKELLEFLLQNLSPLNIDINSKGEKSGTAMDIAVKNKNEEAIKLLSQYV